MVQIKNLAYGIEPHDIGIHCMRTCSICCETEKDVVEYKKVGEVSTCCRVANCVRLLFKGYALKGYSDGG